MPKEMNTQKQKCFSEKFAEAWANPSPDRLTALLHPDVVLRQPHLPPIRGRDAAHREFRKLFTWLPNLFGTVDRYAENGDLAFIEWRLQIPVGNKYVEIPAVDRFFIEEGLGKERVVYLDQMQMNAAILKNPKFWRGFVKYRFGN